MIKATELRLGNWILPQHDLDGKYHLVKKLEAGLINDYTEEWYSPITLTPEILERCGFYKERDVYDKNKFVLHHNKDFGDFRYNRTDGNSTSLFFLHRLQNLYFELKGEELKITPYKAK